jgi:NADPH:quinone reductase-like Zn-dependent oxidoreductase
MRAAVLHGPGQRPRYGEFPEPVAAEGEELISVHAAALSQLTRSRASGAHYSSEGKFPSVAGADGVGTTADQRRVYFVLPEEPHGAMAERTVVRSAQCIDLPAGIDDATAAAIANPGMSSWAALAERAHLQVGETVLINGATGIAGRLAVQIAKHLGASKVIATGRDAEALNEVRALGADVVIPFDFRPSNPEGRRQYEAALEAQFAHGVGVVVDYLWGSSAEAAIFAIAKRADDTAPVRFIHVGGASGAEVELPGAALRSSSIVLMGSGFKSVPARRLLASIQGVFDAVVPARLRIATRVVPLAGVAEAWDGHERARIVFVPP